MIRVILAILLTMPAISWCQTTTSRISALNNYAAYANNSAEEVRAVYLSILEYYPKVKYYQKSQSYVPRYECRVTPDEYYYNKAITESKILTDAATLNAKVNALQVVAETIDAKCKALDTYHKLEDYKRDNFHQAEILIDELQKALITYRSTQLVLATALENSWQKLNGGAGGAYFAMDQMMKKEIVRERNFLDLWSYNLNDGVHTGWPVAELQASIQQTDAGLNTLKNANLSIAYPANSMVDSFREALGTILSAKRSGLDGNNYEAKQSDKHSNEVYVDLANYFNGQLVVDHNMFMNFSSPSGYSGLVTLTYVPLYEIRTTVRQESNSIVPFQDIAYTAFKVAPQVVPISAATETMLDKYIEFINESTRNINNLMRVLETYNSDATSYKDLKTYKGRGGLTYRYEGYQIPLSLYQAATGNTSPAGPVWRKSVNDQSHVLLNILTEMDQLSAALQEDASKKNYEKDNLAKAYGILERYHILFNLWDSRKEQLYKDLRAVAESYPIASPAGSWAKSSKVLMRLLDEDRVQLAKVRLRFEGDTTSHPLTTVIDRQLREVLSNEYANMKGIQELGRSNGNDPYTPYEEVAQTSKSFSEKINDKSEPDPDQYMGPYHPYVNFYNDVAKYYNKFCELAEIRILQTVQQTEYFVVEYPDKSVKEEATFPELPPVELPVTKKGDSQAQLSGSKEREDERPRGRTIHDTIKVTDIIRIETRRSDTVYIEKHDTIYKDKAGEKLLSLDGYATNNLVFLLDVSGSMNTGQKLPLLKKSMLLLLKILREEDYVSIVVYSGKARTVLAPTSAKEREKIKKVIENLTSDGDTDGNAGIKLAYKTANGNYIRAGNNRIVLATDGEFKVSDETMALVSRLASADIFLSVFNFGQSPEAAKTLQKISRLGNGNYENITRQNCDVKLIAEAKSKGKN